jgi:hypothetical protein
VATSEELVDLFVEWEGRARVAEWTIDGIHIWPLLRYEIFTRNYSMHGRTAVPSSDEVPGVGARVRAMGTTWRRWLDARWNDRGHEARLRSADFLVYSDGVSFVRHEDRWYDRFCDPIAEAAAARGRTTLIVTPSPTGELYVPREHPSLLVQPAFDVAALADAMHRRLAPAAAPGELSGFDDWRRAVRAEHPELIVPDRSDLERIVRRLRALARIHRFILGRVQPRAVFVVCYYGEAMALLLAARELGIPTVDVQHSFAAPLHWAYAKWTNVPRGGYELLPDFFWSWSAADVELVRAWAHGLPRHRAVEVGNLYLRQWQSSDTPLFRGYRERVAAIVREAGPRKHVLFTASGLESPAVIRDLAELVGATSSELHWWVRMHPVRRARSADFEAALRAHGGSWRVAEATEWPLYALLPAMNAHVTEASSTTVEAAQLGVPTVLTSPNEASLYANLIEAGYAVAAASFSEVRAAVMSQIAHQARLAEQGFGRAGLGFDAMLNALRSPSD